MEDLEVLAHFSFFVEVALGAMAQSASFYFAVSKPRLTSGAPFARLLLSGYSSRTPPGGVRRHGARLAPMDRLVAALDSGCCSGGPTGRGY